MKIHILTTQNRDSSAVQKFWKSHGWDVVIYDNTGRHPGPGRNAILDAFYDSSDEWLAMCDDDMTIDVQRGWGQQFLNDPGALLSKLHGRITSWGLMNNIHHRVDVTLNNPQVQKHWTFYKASWIGCLVFHRNTGQRFYNHESDILEDMDWCLDQIQAGHRVAHCMNLVQKNLGGAKSTVFDDQNDRRSRYHQAKCRIAQSYPDITLTAKNKLVKTRFMNRYYNSSDWTSVANIGPCILIDKH